MCLGFIARKYPYSSAALVGFHRTLDTPTRNPKGPTTLKPKAIIALTVNPLTLYPIRLTTQSHRREVGDKVQINKKTFEIQKRVD